MARRLPPLNALRAFEAVARLGSVRAAAAELHVTPAAVSQQVKALEADLGRPLTRRRGNALELTDAGGAGLADLLRARGDDLVGIRNGIDTAVWDPATDPGLPAPYHARALGDRAANRAALQARFSFSGESLTILL